MNIIHPRESKTKPSIWRRQSVRLFAACALLLVQSPLSARADERQYLHGMVPAAVATAAKVRPSLKIDKLNLSIGLPLRNSETLTNMLTEMYDPSSPNFHHFLTPAQFTEKFGPTQEDYEAVVKFAKANGLTVTGQFPNRMVVGVRGTVLQIEKAMHVSLNEYKHPTENRTFRAPDREPSLDLAVPIRSIGGLDNFIIPTRNARLMPTNTAQASPSGKLNPGSNPVPQTGSGPSGTYESRDFRAAYAAGVTNTGTGQNVGLLEFDSGYYQSDITAFETACSEPNVPVYAVLLDGYGGGAGSGNDEVSLDIEMAIGMAPGLSGVYVYEGNLTDTILGSMASMSNGPCYTLSASWGYGIDATSDDLWLEMAAQGQSFFNASGDDDAYVGAPSSPNSDPNITTVGGTFLTTTGALGTWTGETVWNDNPSPAGQGTGGGISTTIPIPIWQQGISMANNQGSTTFRNIPDVAACADNIEVWYGNGSSGSFVGTSCATPTWAAYVALVNQLAVANGQPTVGFINPAVYNMGKGSNALPYTSLFHDVTSGNNEWASSPNLYTAAVGYDLCTGWGSMIGSNMLAALGLPEALRISPFTPTLFTGPVGGPFTPATSTYVLTNKGTGPLNWVLSSTPSWLDVSLTSGTLTPGGASASVVLSVDPSATSLATGDYTAEVTFTNTTDGVGQSVLVTLAVVVPPVITSQPSPLSLLAGQTATFNVGVASNALVYYKWQLQGVNLTDGSGSDGYIIGSSTSNLTITNINTLTAGQFSVVVSNAAGAVTSSNAQLIIQSSKPVFQIQPPSTNALPGSTTSLNAYAVGTATITYHWYFNGVSLANSSGKYGGVSTPTLYITNVNATNGGTFTVVCSNSLGTTTSSNAIFTPTVVTAPGYGLTVPVSFSTATTSSSVALPLCGVVYDAAQSAYYGTSVEGGKYGYGNTYKVTAAGAVTSEYSITYQSSSSGYYMVAGVCLASDGNLYGLALFGNTYDDGFLFKEAPTSTTATTEVLFNGDNGLYSASAMMQASDNNLYGVMNEDGAYGYGTVYKVTGGTTTNLTTLTSFNGADGAFPSSILVQGKDGNLYGTSESGGPYASGAGNVWRISTTGVFKVLYNFTGTNDGNTPIAGVVQANDGNFYGTTLTGGTYNEGTVYKITPAGVLTTLYSFTGATDGAEPWGGVIQASDGNLYGTTQQGGTYGDGTVFQISLTGTENTIAELDGYQGATPQGNLVQGPDGNLYGTTEYGGSSGDGVFLSITLTNKGTLAIDGQPVSSSVYTGATAGFGVATTGSSVTSYQWLSNGVTLANGGAYSGATTAFLTISNVTAANAASYSVLVTGPSNSVTSSSALLTVLNSGPVITSQPVSQSNVVGSLSVFSVVATGDQALTYQWQVNGANLANGGAFSGVTTSTLTISNLVLTNSGSYSVLVSDSVTTTPSSPGILTVVPVSSAAVTFSTLHNFAGGPADGVAPSSTLIQGIDGNLYGTAATGGTSYSGTVFRSTLAGTVTTLFSFPAALNYEGANISGGSIPEGGLIQYKTNLYGTLSSGGANDVGSIFRMSNYSTVAYPYTFAGTTDGSAPDCTLVMGTDGNFYGTASQAGASDAGSIYKMTPTGTLTVLYSFTGLADGEEPFAGLLLGSDGNFYGTTAKGGAYGYGTLYNVTSNGVLTTLAAFNYTNGAVPFGTLVQASDGNYYGTTSQGGTNGDGTIFKWSATNGLTTFHTFAGTDGDFPGAGLIQGKDGNLYGTTEADGLGGQGTVYLITTNGVLTTLVWFNGFNGAEPLSTLVQASDGNFYGTAAFGGTAYDYTSGGGNGTIYKLTAPTPPVITVPSNITVIATNDAGNIVTFTPTATDANDGVITPVSSPASGSVFPIGTNLVTVTVTDSLNLSATNSFLVIVEALPPVITVPSNITDFATNAAGDVETFTVTATDTIDGSITPLVVPASGSIFPIGTNLVTATVTDSVGLSATNTFLVIIQDVPPVITSEPVSETNTVGSTASFSVGVTAFTPVSYVWYFGTNALVGQTNSTLVISPVSPTNAGVYYVTVTDDVGSTNSTPASLSVIYQAPSLLTTPLVYGTNGFQFTFSGPAGQTYEVLSSDLISLPVNEWTVVGTGTFGSTNVVFTDPNATNNPVEYYIIESP